MLSVENGHPDAERDGRVLRREREHGKNDLPCLADHEQDWQPFPVDPYNLLKVITPRCCCCCCMSHSAYWLPTRKNYFTRSPIPLNSILVRWTLGFGMDSQQVFGGFGRKGSRLRCFVVKLIWPSWNCGQFDGMYVEIGYAWISMVTEEVKGTKYFKILEYPPGFG